MRVSQTSNEGLWYKTSEYPISSEELHNLVALYDMQRVLIIWWTVQSSSFVRPAEGTGEILRLKIAICSKKLSHVSNTSNPNILFI